ncbi:MAG: serine hydrolase, partial [Pseudomonadota bacterium]
LLAEEGLLSFEDPVRRHIPELRFADPYITENLTIRDLLTHRSGLPLGAGDLLFWPQGDAPFTDILKVLSTIEPVAGFRNEFLYNNILYLVAGEVVARVSDMPWTDYIESRIFEPLGMRRCRANYQRASKLDNLAVPHMFSDGEIKPTFDGGEAVGAAGAINCSMKDLARWAAMWTREGQMPDGSPFISKKTYAMLTKPVTPLSPSALQSAHARSLFRSYAHGWFTSDYRGHRIIEHGGTLHGVMSRMLIVPDKDLAIVASGNQWTQAANASVFALLDLMLGDDSTDWVELYANQSSNEPPTAKKISRQRPVRSLETYEGTYSDRWFGDAVVSRRGRNLFMSMSRSKVLKGPMTPVGPDRFVVRWQDRTLNADAYVLFRPDASGQIERIEMEWVDPDTDFSYDFHNLDLRRKGSDEAQE